MSTGPATRFVAALDAPLPFLREHFGAWAPTVALFTYLGSLATLPAVFLNTTLQDAVAQQDTGATLAAMGGVYGSLCLFLPVGALASAVQSVCLTSLVLGRPADLGTSFRALSQPGFLGPFVVGGIATGMAYAACCFGGFLLFLPAGLLLPTAAAERGGGHSLTRGVELAMMRTGPGFFDRPGWKAVAVVLTWYLLTFAINGIAQTATFVAMGFDLWESIAAGDFEAIGQYRGVNPWVTAVSTLLTASIQIFPTGYLYAALALIYRDAVELRDGSGLAAALREGAAG